jgi:hypothetical protein
LRGERLDVARDRERGALVAFLDGEVEQVARFGQALGQAADAADDALEARAFLAEVLRALGIVPDVGMFEFAGDFFEPLGLGLEVKDTP